MTRAFLSLLLPLLPLAVAAQTPASPPADTTTGVFLNNRYSPATLTWDDGHTSVVYVLYRPEGPGFDRILKYYTTRPAPDKPRPHIEETSVQKIKSLALAGHYLEAMRLEEGFQPTHLAEQMPTDGPVELFLVAERGSILPGYSKQAVKRYGYDRPFWFVRRAGRTTFMSPGNFAKLMADFVADDPALAAHVRNNEPGYQKQDVPAIIAQYNQFLKDHAGK